MNQRETDMLFWNQEEDDWAELAAKPIIMSEASNHPSVREVVRMLAMQGYISQQAMGIVQRRLADEWELGISDVDQLVDMQIEADLLPEVTE
jgi:hypothetical protein